MGYEASKVACDPPACAGRGSETAGTPVRQLRRRDRNRLDRLGHLDFLLVVTRLQEPGQGSARQVVLDRDDGNTLRDALVQTRLKSVGRLRSP